MDSIVATECIFLCMAHCTEWMALFAVAAPCFAYSRSPCCSRSISRSDCHSSSVTMWESAVVTMVGDDLHDL
jgi:hypothetical protein